MKLSENYDDAGLSRESILYNTSFNDTFKKIFPALTLIKRTLSPEETQRLSEITDIFFAELKKSIYRSYRIGFKDGENSSLSGK